MYWKITPDLFVGFTLGLSGGWVFQKKMQTGYQHPNFYGPNQDYLATAITHINVIFEFENGTICFYDQLSFGTIKIFTGEELGKKINSIGLDIMDVNTTVESFVEALTRPRYANKPVGIVLLDQKCIAGIGNYLRADVLWQSRISPFRKMKKLSESELKTIFDNTRLLTWVSYDYEKAIKLKIIKKSTRLPVDYKNEFLIYNKEKDIYNNEITKEKLYEGAQIRYIYWVPKLQT